MTDLKSNYQTTPDFGLGLGICGSHRTGKTTLAMALSEVLKIPFIPIEASSVFLQYGFHPSAKMDLRNRLFIQQKILEMAEDIWFQVDKPSFISDRTPLDMAAYLLADVCNGDLDDHTQNEIMAYLGECDRITKKYFNKLVFVPIAIPIVQAEYKAAINLPLMYELQSLILGRLCELEVTYQKVPKDCLKLGDRVDFISGFWSQK